jgi:thiamine kinase-like enzyme
MAAKIIKELHGFSGTKIFLMKKREMLFVRKEGSIDRNVERMYALKDMYPLPEIYGYSKNKFDMEYIHGLDIKNYLTNHPYDNLLMFLTNLLDSFSTVSIEKDYSEVYLEKLDAIDFDDDIIFSKNDIYKKLPKVLPSSEYHGDLTLENILYSDKRGFLLIDCQTTEYDSYIFDIAKLRQDLTCKWFLRHDSAMIDLKLQHIQTELLKRYKLANNDYLLILMLLRVYRYSKPNTLERKFLKEWMNKLWK